MSYRAETLTVRDRHIRLMRGGTGQPLLYLHDTFSYTWTPVHDALAEHYEVIFPIHPGCVGSGDLDDIEGMDDLVFHYLDHLDTMLARWFPKRAAVGKLLFHKRSIDHHGGESP